ncbi:hypothetical protein TorRG33x02_156020 [Trema orientale]|uniref:Uncharacterized protein n=1 Tax=Trema orientale TaxID=63057 RepID=A0A2P5ESN0_TREOI|nr:hypothetical protein TorRG33x02_156020 [Trema orientale]
MNPQGAGKRVLTRNTYQALSVKHRLMKNVELDDSEGRCSKLVNPAQKDRQKYGLMLLWNEDIDIAIQSYSMGHIDAEFSSERSLAWHFTAFNSNPKASNQHFSWDLMHRLKSLSTRPWLALADYELVDLGFNSPLITWNNKRDGKANVQEQLDRSSSNSPLVEEGSDSGAR